MATWLDVVTQAAQELGYVAGGESLTANDSTFLLNKLNRLLDNWNAERAAVYTDTFNTYTLTPALSPHTIGPTGATFTAAIRPVSIVSANIVQQTVTPSVRTPLYIADEDWWMANTVRAVTSSIPTALFYQPTWPNGNLYLWPVPTTAYQIELQTRTLLASVTLAGTFALPPGYQDAITLTLAEDSAGALGRPMPSDLQMKAAKARGRIFVNNDYHPRISTVEGGMQSRRSRGSFNWQTGQIV